MSVPAQPEFRCDPAEDGTSIRLDIGLGGGLVDEYILTCLGDTECSYPSRTIPYTDTDVVFSGLEPFMSYTFTIKAVKKFTNIDPAQKESTEFSHTCQTKERSKYCFICTNPLAPLRGPIQCACRKTVDHVPFIDILLS